MRNAYSILDGKRKEKRTFWRPGKVILEWILGKECRKFWTEFIWLRIRD
jgi:hypothetical protein